MRDEPPLEIGIGLATGNVLAASIGSSRTQRYTVFGEPVMQVQAVCAAARAGQLMINEEAHRVINGRFTTEEAHTIRLKDGSVRCFEVLGASESPPERPWSYLG